MALTREDYVQQSVQDYLRSTLFGTLGFPEDQIDIIDAWDGQPLDSPLPKNVVASGFDFDDGGRAAEMGSDLTFRVYAIEFIVFGKTPTWGRNLANGVRSALEQDGVVPLVDISAAGRPEIDRLVVDSVAAARQNVPRDADEWLRYVWAVTLRLEDTYFARVVV